MNLKKNIFIKEICQLIKSLINFCKYEIEIKQDELSLHCSINDLTKIMLFLETTLRLIWNVW